MFVVFKVALGIVPQNSVVNSIVLIVSLDNPAMAFMITKLYTTHVVVYVQILSKLPVVFAEIRPPKPKKIKSNSCTFSVRRSVSVRFRFRRIRESAHRVQGILFFRFGFGSVSVFNRLAKALIRLRVCAG